MAAVGKMKTEQVWKKFHAQLQDFVRRRVAAGDVDDVVQEVFLRIHSRIGSLRREDRISGWIYQIARNVIIDFYRASGRNPEFSVEGAELDGGFASVDTADAEGAEQELSHCIRLMVHELPPAYREALERVELSGDSQVEAAHTVGISVSGMKSRVQRGRRRLEAMLRDCCQLQLGVGGGIVDYEQRSGKCGNCSPCGDESGNL